MIQAMINILALSTTILMFAAVAYALGDTIKDLYRYPFKRVFNLVWCIILIAALTGLGTLALTILELLR